MYRLNRKIGHQRIGCQADKINFEQTIIHSPTKLVTITFTKVLKLHSCWTQKHFDIMQQYTFFISLFYNEYLANKIFSKILSVQTLTGFRVLLANLHSQSTGSSVHPSSSHFDTFLRLPSGKRYSGKHWISTEVPNTASDEFMAPKWGTRRLGQVFTVILKRIM